MLPRLSEAEWACNLEETIYLDTLMEYFWVNIPDSDTYALYKTNTVFALTYK